MPKRKRIQHGDGGEKGGAHVTKKAKMPETGSLPHSIDGEFTIQIVAGSYDRVLHGVTATMLGGPKSETAKFFDTFLFNAHSSAIRCLALSQPSAPVAGQMQKVLLATGSTDERINIFNLSAHPPSAKTADDQKLLSSLSARPVAENPKHRELGTLLHHSSTVTRLVFPLRSKLLSASEDSTVAVTRARDWNMLHAFRCPVPKAQGRPSGDTAAHGAVPSGVNDFAVHPSLKIMISVSKGERCMRLWNLVTGKKAGVHNFKRETLAEIGEGRHSTGEARKIVWGGENELAVGFSQDVVVYSMEIKPKCRVMRDVKTKYNQFFFVTVDDTKDESLLAVSTDDGRILFFSTRLEEGPESSRELPNAKLVAQLGGKDAGVCGRIKDFAVLPCVTSGGEALWYIVTGSSDGELRVWRMHVSDVSAQPVTGTKQVGTLVGSYKTPNRITCIGAFIMIPRPDGREDSEYEFDDGESDGDSD